MEEKNELTFPQQNIWLVDKLYENSLFNIITGVINIKKEFNAKFCKKAINTIIQNNDAMRINIEVLDDIPCQKIIEFTKQDIFVKDMENYSQNDIDEYINKFKKEPIHILDKKLYEFQILKYSDNSGSVLLKMHHIISDAWSYSKIIEQFIKEYTRLENNDTTNDVNKMPSYTDFINSTVEYKNSDKYKKDEEFFAEYLKDINESVVLKDKIQKITNISKRYNIKLGKDINDNILEYCKKNRISPYVLFLSALSTYIYRIKDANDFVMGTPSLNRANFKEKQMLGMFVATLPLRIKVEENIKFIDLAHSISSNTMTIFRHQRYPYINTLKHVRKENNTNSNLYNIVLSYQNARANYEEDGKYSTKWYPNDYQNEDLLIHILDMDSTGILEINYDYLSELFEDIEIEYLHTRLMAIIENAILDENVNVENIEIMSKEEKNKILYEFNDTKTEYPKDKSVIDLFEEQVEKTPESIALVFEDKKLTYRELNEKANAVAHYLVEEKNVKKTDIVGIKFKRSIDMIVSILGVAKARAAYVPIDPEFPEDRIKYMMENSKSSILLEDISNIDYSKISNININFELDDPFYVLYTSGSTGKPKGVVITNKNIINFAYGMNKIFNINENDKILSITTVSFDIFELELWLPIINGARMILANDDEKYNVYLLNKLCLKNDVNVMQTTPSVYKSFLCEKSNCKFFKNMDKVILGGEKVSKILFNQLKNVTNANIYDGYGPTETTIYSAMKLLKENISVGRPPLNTEILIKDKKSRILPLGISGELCISGDGVSKGYLNNIEVTNKSFYNLYGKKWYKTGDLANIDFDLNLIILDRIDLQVKINGQRLEVEEIEKEIYNTKKVKECVVILNNNRLTCVYIGKEEDKNIIINQISRKLPTYMIPKNFVTLDEMPRTANGKIDRKKIKNIKFESENFNIDLPTTLIQKDLGQRIANILNENKDIDINSNLFELGCDSLSIMQLTSEIRQEYNIIISPKEIMENPNIKKIENLIQTSRVQNNKKENIGEDNVFELTDMQKSIYNEYLKNNNSVLYNMPFEISLSNEIDYNKLIDSTQKSILNHSILFSNFILKNSKIYYRINYNNECKIKLNKVNSKEYNDLKESFVRPFDFSNNSKWFRVEMYELEDSIKILFDFSHIFVDGYSIKILLNDISNYYNNEKIEKEKMSFGECVRLNRKYSEADREFYLNEFEGEMPNTHISYDNLKNDNISSIYDVRYKNKKQLLEYCRKNNLTLNNLILGIFTFVLSKYTYNEDLVLGITDVGRNLYYDKNTLGMFVKTFPYRVNIDVNDSIINYLNKIQEKLSDYSYHNCYSYKDLISELNIKSHINNFVNIVYNFQSSGLSDFKLSNIKAEISRICNNTSKFDMVFGVIENNESVDFSIEYNSSLYLEDTIVSFSNSIKNALDHIINYKDILLRDIEIISLEEKEIILKQFNDTNSYYDKSKCVHQIFEQNAKINPNKKAIVFEDSCLTYKELNEKSNQVANYLIENFVSKNQIIGVMIDKSLEYMIAILGVLKSGCCYVPITNDLPIERAKYMIENSNCTCLLTTNKFDRKDISICDKIYIDLDSDIYNTYDNNNLNLNYSIENLIHIIYTSGSTGLPKGNMIKHKGILRLLLNTNYIDFTENDVMLCSGSLTFDTSGFEIWGAMMYGMTLHMVEKNKLLNPIYYSEYLLKNKITVTFLPTPIFNQLIGYNPKMFSSLNSVYVGGDVLLPKYANIFYNNCHLTKLYNAYGPAEITVICCAMLIKRVYHNDIPLGKITSNNKVYVLDKCFKFCPINVPGELFVSGDGLGNGYINREDLTREKFINVEGINELVYRSGDLTKWNKKGCIRYISRIDTQFKLRGQRVEILEIQNRMLKLKQIKEVAFKILSLKNGEKALVAYYTTYSPISESEINNYLKKFLPIYMIPYKLMCISEIPLNQNGKINIKLLPDNIETKKDIKPPENEQQKKIYESFCKVLKKEDISIDDNFFEIGGDSLVVIQLLLELNKRGIIIQYSDIFKYNTIEEIYNFIIFDKCKLDSYDKDINTYDYSKIKELLLKQNFDKSETNNKNNKGVLLTGVTGYLGAHILRELIRSNIYKVLCLVRKKDGEDIFGRINKILKFYFGETEAKSIIKKITLIEGDITKEKIINDEYLEFIKDIDIVVNCAAYVKHFGDEIKFNSINVLGVKNIVKFCLKYNKELMHISTLSISGNIIEGNQVYSSKSKNIDFTEKSFYVGQRLDNIYTYTKFLGERIILENILNNNLKAKIIRIGNLTNRYYDGKFQINPRENAFFERIKSFLNIKVVPDSLKLLKFDMTPIDYISKAFVVILNINTKNIIFHLYNDNDISVKEFVDFINSSCLFNKVQFVSEEEVNMDIKYLLQDPKTINRISGILSDLDDKSQLKYLVQEEITSYFTSKLLKKYDFYWPKISKEYILKSMEYLKKINFFDNKGDIENE